MEVGAPETEINAKRKELYDGEIHKCPNCGEPLKAFETVCPICKFELRGTTTASSVKEFITKLESTSLEEKRIEIIKNFYIPNTKEDIYEFFIFAMSNLHASEKEAEAWQVKLEQTYHKAKFSFGNTTEFEYIHKLYAQNAKKRSQKIFRKLLVKNWKVILFIVGVLMMVLATINPSLGRIGAIGMSLVALAFWLGIFSFFKKNKKK